MAQAGDRWYLDGCGAIPYLDICGVPAGVMAVRPSMHYLEIEIDETMPDSNETDHLFGA